MGPGVGSVKVSDEVIGFTDKRASHAEYVIAEARNLTPKPAGVSWEVAGSLAIAGSTAYAAVHAVSLKPGDTVAVSAAAGGVRSIVVQLARRAGAQVIGIASPANHAWLSQHGVEAVAYGEGLADRLRKFGLNAFIDCHGGGYVSLAIELGMPKDRIDTIIDFAAAQQYGVKTEGGQEARNSRILAELAGLVAEGKLDRQRDLIEDAADRRRDDRADDHEGDGYELIAELQLRAMVQDQERRGDQDDIGDEKIRRDRGRILVFCKPPADKRSPQGRKYSARAWRRASRHARNPQPAG